MNNIENGNNLEITADNDGVYDPNDTRVRKIDVSDLRIDENIKRLSEEAEALDAIIHNIDARAPDFDINDSNKLGDKLISLRDEIDRLDERKIVLKTVMLMKIEKEKKFLAEEQKRNSLLSKIRRSLGV